MSSVLAVFEFHGVTEDMAASYDEVLHKVAAVSSARPVIHLAVPREYGLMVLDVWNSVEAFTAFENNDDFHRVLRESGLPEPKIRTYPIHNLGWPVEAMSLYR